jgi:polyhydroxybutyrate depolymerase
MMTTRTVAAPVFLVLALCRCSQSSTGGDGEQDGATSTANGGSFTGTGGEQASGGVSGSGGTTTAGGTGGATATGGTTSAGGTISTGGMISTGGAISAGGTVSTGGVAGSGGDVTTGGAGGAPMPATCPSSATLVPGESTRTIDVGGTSRSYILHVPTSYTGQTPVPLVLDFHPIFGTGAGEEAISGYRALSDQEGFIVAFPNGIDNAWNIGPCCTFSRTVDDEGFARAMVTEISTEGCVDPKRVYATGYSMGGGMSHYLACNAADVFAAVAPAAFDLLQDSEEPCAPSRPISVISFRGTADPIVPYSGGASNPPNGLQVTIHFLGAQGTFDKWKTLDGCTGTATTSGECATYSTCSEGVEVELCTKQGGGHDPGDANVGWEFMKRHPMP